MQTTRERGFTLVEMITVIAIMMIVMGMLFANFRNFGGVTALNTDAKNIASLIGQARQKSISVVQFGTQYPSYGVNFNAINPNNTIATLYAACNVNLSSGSYYYGNPAGNCTGGQDVEVLTLKGSRISSLSYVPAGGGWNFASVLFVRPDPTTLIYRQNNAQPQNTGTLTITLTSTSDNTVTRTVTVNSNGHIRVGN